MSEFNPEFRLLLAGALHPLQETEVEHLRACCSQAIDWQAFAALVERHKLIPTIYRNINTYAAALVPQPVLAALKEQAGLNQQRILQLLGELNRISELFSQAGIQLCVLKGPLLAQRLFGDVALRTSTDLDLLVHPGALAQAEALLLAHGSQRVLPGLPLTPRQWEMYRREWYHNTFFLPGPRIYLELHWSIVSPDLIAPETVRQMLNRARPLEQFGGRLDTLAEEDLPAYLLVHGSKHNWVRLKWLVDIAVWMRGTAAPDWQSVQSRMGELGLQRSLGQGVLLAHQLFAVPIPGELPSSITQDSHIQKLAGSSLKAIQDLSYRGGEFGKLMRLKRILYTMQLKQGISYKWNTVRNLWMVPYDWQDVPLPDSLFPLYGLLRPFLWLRRWLKHRRRNQPAALPPKSQ